MKTKYLFLSMLLLSGFMVASGQETFDFTTTGSCASYIQWHNAYSLQADSIYEIVKTNSKINIDAVADEADWSNANAKVIAKIAHMPGVWGPTLDLSAYPQTEEYEHAVFKALWTDEGVYMFITVKDQYPRYQYPVGAWENDAIEFFYAKAPGEGFKQIIIPAMIGTADPSYPAALDYESGSLNGSQTAYKVYGYDETNWDESLFTWAIKRTAVGWDMEVYMDKDIVTNGNSTTHYGKDKIFSGDINIDVAGLHQNATSGFYDREGTLCMLGNDVFEYSQSAHYGYFKMVDSPNGINTPIDAKFTVNYNSDSKKIRISSSTLVSSVEVYNVAGQVMPTSYKNATISVSQLKQGVYMVKAKDQIGNNLGIQKIVVY